MKPITKYAKSADVNIAYQVVGEGPVNLLFIPGWVSNIDMMWVDKYMNACLSKLASFTRLILFDKRGTGLSDRVGPICSLEERMDDIISVMDAAGIEKTILFGHSEGGTITSLFAAKYPERTISLITFGSFAKREYSIDYPWAPKPEEREVFYKAIEHEWGNGQKMGLGWIMPSMIQEKEYFNWFASYLRSAASPGDALALAKMNTNSDVTDILEEIKVPALILHRVGDLDVNVEEAKYLAHKIPNAQFIELGGTDHCFWVGDSFSVLAEIENFITGFRPTRNVSTAIDTMQTSTKIDIKSTMLKNFKYDLKIEDFAKLCGRSLSVFKRDFEELFHTTPYRWVKVKRLHYAKVLLQESDLNVNQICFECGFKNNSHFVESFRKQFNLPPNQYRAKNFIK